MLKNELSTSQDQNKKQTDELNQFQEQIVALKVEQATVQEKCRLALDEVGDKEKSSEGYVGHAS